tara:strand:- start:674 stop:1408 length:735 start_codon:yes stop_codon:yes gene_type:complete
MATNVSAMIRFSDGTFTYLRDEVTLNTLTELKTDASGDLNIAGDLSVGLANQGKTATAVLIKVQTDDASTGVFGYGYFTDPQGRIIVPCQGGGTGTTGLPQLKKAVRMTTGVKLSVFASAVTASGTAMSYANVSVYCASGMSDVFSILSTDGVVASLLNKDGNTIGEALAGQTILCTISTFASTNGVADVGIVDGVNGFYLEDSQGVLKMMYNPCKGNGQEPTPWIEAPVRINQNDTLSVLANS